MTYAVMVKHPILGAIVADLTEDETIAYWIKDDLPGSWVEVLDDKGKVQE